MRNLKANQKGFTLLEMLISTAIFVIITMIALNIYTSILRANRKSLAITRLHRDSEVIMSALAKKIRQSLVDYTYNYTGALETGKIPSPAIELALVDIDGVEYVFNLDTDNDTIQVSVAEDDPVDIPSGNVAITDLRFYVKPDTDPFPVIIPSQAPDFPRVTIVLELESRQTAGIYSSSLVVQQTVPQRGGGY